MSFYGNIEFMITVYGIPNCDAVKKARAWLTEKGLMHSFHDFKKCGVPESRLTVWASAVGEAKLVNRQGTTWRKLDAAKQASASNPQGAHELMVANPSVIKRPVVQWQDGRITVGFDSNLWVAAAAK